MTVLRYLRCIYETLRIETDLVFFLRLDEVFASAQIFNSLAKSSISEANPKQK